MHYKSRQISDFVVSASRKVHKNNALEKQIYLKNIEATTHQLNFVLIGGNLSTKNIFRLSRAKKKKTTKFFTSFISLSFNGKLDNIKLHINTINVDYHFVFCSSQ